MLAITYNLLQSLHSRDRSVQEGNMDHLQTKEMSVLIHTIIMCNSRRILGIRWQLRPTHQQRNPHPSPDGKSLNTATAGWLRWLNWPHVRWGDSKGPEIWRTGLWQTTTASPSPPSLQRYLRPGITWHGCGGVGRDYQWPRLVEPEVARGLRRGQIKQRLTVEHKCTLRTTR